MALSPLAADFLAATEKTSVMAAYGFVPDPWQEDLISSRRNCLVCCARQVGKSTAIAALAAHQFYYSPGSLTLIVSPREDQSAELLKKVRNFLLAMPGQGRLEGNAKTSLEGPTGSRVLALPGTDGSTRGYSPDLLILEECAHMSDSTIDAVLPSVAVTGGRVVMISTPAGRVGRFFRFWIDSEEMESKGLVPDYDRIHATYEKCSRYKPEFIAAQRRSLGEYGFAQEFLAQFTASDRAVFDPFSITKCFDLDIPPAARIEGGILI